MVATVELNPETLLAGDERGEALINRAIALSLEEDLGTGDITTLSTVPADVKVSAALWFKQQGVIAGLPVFARVFALIDRQVKLEVLHGDGQFISSPTVIARLEGPARSILTGERVALNFLQRLSAVATAASRFVLLAQKAGISILDTRKTTPGLRVLERYAVRVGGGVNHRFNLSDAILIKDNHVSISGGVREAIRRARASQGQRRLEVETTTLEEVRIAIEEQADAILLDNMAPELVARAVATIGGRCFVEVSGGVTLENLGDYLIPGVDAISIGAITHSAGSIDISLEIEA